MHYVVPDWEIWLAKIIESSLVSIICISVKSIRLYEFWHQLMDFCIYVVQCDIIHFKKTDEIQLKTPSAFGISFFCGISFF